MKIYFETYGCTSNKADTRVMEALAKKAGHEVSSSYENADMVVINTCVVIKKTEKRMLRRIKELKDKNLVVAGCLSEVNPDEAKALSEDIDFVSPRDLGKFFVIIGGDEKKIPKYEVPVESDGVFGQLQISEGCVGNCSYCVTKFARSPLRAFPKNKLVANAKKLIHNGVLELQLTAQDTATYGLDEENDLFDLVSEINAFKDDFRIRIGMMNPSNVKDKMDRLKRVFKLDKTYNFFHLPVQSGSNEVLEAMNRSYTVKDFKEIISVYKNEINGVISTDVIAGFPGETERDFRKTISLLKEVEPDIINITRYSNRPGTKASEMEEIDSKTKKERSKQLTQIKKEIGRNNREKEVGAVKEVLVLKNGKRDTMVGRDWDYNTVVIRNDEVSIGDSIEVKIKDYTFAYLIGDLI